ncbi:hypothetical protein [Xylocopilactobacillus apicola]|uniref:Lipoprotein n=1 Tax=Xylocopilactobacillus apicola TaxID=2932184 RepID=A0AAU9D7K5_9LACO|nr:hypothetical protein [Xylocopilactobacillus apicola]BDR58361.1 hypothetical protein XA3_08020 [Xylocopilactobacillus apicola]
MKFKKRFAIIASLLLLFIFAGCQNQNSAPKTLRLAETINSSDERIWYVCYTEENKDLKPDTEVGGVLVTKDAKITAYITAASHKTLKDFNSKKSNDEQISYAKKLSKKGSIGKDKKKSVITKDSKVNLYMDMTGEKVAGEGINEITAPDYFMTRIVNKTKIGDFNYAGLKDPRINSGTGQASYYLVTRLDNDKQKFEFDKPDEKNTKKVYMKSYPKKKSTSNKSSKSESKKDSRSGK